MANLSFVSKVRQIKPKQISMTILRQVPEHLKQLYEKTIQDLSLVQCNQVGKLLIEHELIFSENDDDLGRAGLITHRIPTGDAHRIKQPLRRLPVHMQGEADKQIQ